MFFFKFNPVRAYRPVGLCGYILPDNVDNRPPISAILPKSYRPRLERAGPINYIGPAINN